MNMNNLKTSVGKFLGSTTKIGPFSIKTSGYGKTKRATLKITDPTTGKRVMKIKVNNIIDF